MHHHFLPLTFFFLFFYVPLLLSLRVFIYLFLLSPQVLKMRELGIYCTDDGRISIAGLNNNNVQNVAKVIHTVTSI